MDSQTLTKMNRANWDATISWALAVIVLPYGGYRLAEGAGLVIAAGIILLARAVTQEIRSALYPIGIAAIENLDQRK